MAHFLFKTEPSTFSFADLVRDRATVWDGVSNAAALLHLKTIRKGDTIAIYHTGSEKQVVGLATADSDAFPDPELKDPKRLVVRLKAGKALATPVTLADFRADPVLAKTELVRFTRLSILPLTAAQWARLLERGGTTRAR
jgi:predicted RNA-binding protein with PUA-like domain